MKYFYINLDKNFTAQYEGYKNKLNIMRIVQTKDGRNVTSVNALNIFPELFTGKTLPELVLLDVVDDFPSPDQNAIIELKPKILEQAVVAEETKI